MDKQNQFKSCSFHMSVGDVCHVLIKDLTGAGFVVSLNDGEGGEEDTYSLTTTEAPPLSVKYGLLYNWYAATDIRNIAPIGWHIPTVSEWQTLSTYLGGSTVSGGKLKEIEFTYWDDPNMGATNEVGFNGKGGGYRIYNSGSFINLKKLLTCWTSSEMDETYKYAANVAFHNSLISSMNATTFKNQGISVRLLKNSTILTHGQIGTYIGNDGKIYRTICIGTQEWVADNLAETKYRSGDLIPEVTDNATWTALTTGALCAYDNDWDNV